MDTITLSDVKTLLDKSSLVSQLFDVMRIIQGGGTCRVCTLVGDELIPGEESCYSLWQRCDKCVNCASKKACLANEKMVKLEYVDNNYYFVIAQPFLHKGKPYILELITNITTRMTTNEGAAHTGNFVHDLICQLEKITDLESFTGLYNKPYLDKRLPGQMAERAAEGRMLYLAIFDIDSFKMINDLYGHVQGDAVLLQFSEIIKNTICKTASYAVRFGGDEFVIVFDSDSEDECCRCVHQIEEEFAQTIFRVEEMNFSVSASAGLAEISRAGQVSAAIDIADKQLYYSKQAKKGGYSKTSK